jgi:hypothetical protein
MEFMHMPKELNGLSARVLDGLSEWELSHWFPNREEFPMKVWGGWPGSEEGVGGGGAQLNTNVI